MDKQTIASLRSAAHAEYGRAYSNAFRTLAKERNGVNAANRAEIEAEAKAAGRAAGEGIFLAVGYTRCQFTGCTRLASPSYTICPVH